MFRIFQRNKAPSYTLVKSPDEDEENQPGPSSADVLRRDRPWAAAGILVASSILLFLSVSRYAYFTTSYLTDTICTRETSAPSESNHGCQSMETFEGLAGCQTDSKFSGIRSSIGSCKLVLDHVS